MTKGDRIETFDGKPGVVVRGLGGYKRREIKILLDGEAEPRVVFAKHVYCK